MSWTPELMARRAAQEIGSGMIVNLGIGLPTLVANELEGTADVWFHTENGILGMGPYPSEDQLDPQVINAGKQTVTVATGGSCFGSARSFAMIRGGHIDVAVLGAMQVSADGDLANWSIPGGRTMGIGGAMDLAAGAKRIVVLTRHSTKQGEAKLVTQCTYPLTAAAVVHRVITDLAVLDMSAGHFDVVERAPGVSRETLVDATAAPVRFLDER